MRAVGAALRTDSALAQSRGMEAMTRAYGEVDGHPVGGVFGMSGDVPL